MGVPIQPKSAKIQFFGGGGGVGWLKTGNISLLEFVIVHFDLKMDRHNINQVDQICW